MIGKHRLLIHIFISALLNVHGGTLAQAAERVNKNEIKFQIQNEKGLILHSNL